MIDFWVSIGSTYSYLAVMRLKSVEQASGVPFRWRPFSVRAIMIEQKNIPFAGKPVKMAYMWRDIERRARNYGFEPKLPAPYPLVEFDLANRIAIVAASEGWCADYAMSAYRAWFIQGRSRGRRQDFRGRLRKSVRTRIARSNAREARKSASVI